METRLSRWGVGPRIIGSALLYAAAAVSATYRWPEYCIVPLLRSDVVTAIAVIMLAAGVAMWAVSAVTVMQAYNRDQLVTGRTFALVRHPVYSAAIVLMVPACALLTRSWPLLLTPVVAYTVFKLLIHREDEYLEQRYGQSYRDYRARVNELFPIPRFHARR